MSGFNSKHIGSPKYSHKSENPRQYNSKKTQLKKNKSITKSAMDYKIHFKTNTPGASPPARSQEVLPLARQVFRVVQTFRDPNVEYQQVV